MSTASLAQPVMYGIKNCDTIKKARKWLEANDVNYQFHDYRADGLDEVQLTAWVKELGWEPLLNKRGTTWRALPDEIKDTIDETSAIQVMLDNPAAIKRPLLDCGDRRQVGFKAAEYEALFN